MLLPESNINTESSGVLKSSSFGIGNIGVILNILRTKIYKNPVLAVCREITCNARDAHREVSSLTSNPTTTDTPIEVYLPNEFESSLKIRDFGPGISPDRMHDIFVNFGSSTKRIDNVQTGGFGLGAKTPFAYGQSFSVETIVDGVKYFYNAYIDESQVGTMDLMKQVPTSEGNGTTIIVPVNQDDFDRFATTIIECTKHWAV